MTVQQNGQDTNKRAGYLPITRRTTMTKPELRTYKQAKRRAVKAPLLPSPKGYALQTIAEGLGIPYVDMSHDDDFAHMSLPELQAALDMIPKTGE